MRRTLLLAAACMALAGPSAAAQGEAPPAAVKAFVTSQIAAPVAYAGELVVGRPAPAGVPWMSIPQFPQYAWAYLNGLRVVVEISTGVIVAIY
jgi:hypothetical protein